MRPINPDDPKWTAYVLGELDDKERAAVELELEVSEEARMLVEELRFAADLTKAELREAITVAPLTGEQRATIHNAADVVRSRRWFKAPALWTAGVATAAVAAAAILVAVLIPPGAQPLQKDTVSMPSIPVAESRQPETPTAVASADPTKPAPEFELRYQHQAPAVAPETAQPDSAPAKIADALIVEAPPSQLKLDVAKKALSLPLQEPQLQAPASTVSVSGIVQDATAARIPGAIVVATNAETGEKESTVTDQAGVFALDGLEPGKYKVSASLPGFQTTERDGIQLAAPAEAKLDMTLNVAAAAQSVEVTVAPDSNLSTSASVGTARRGLLGGLFGNRKNAAPPPPPPATESRAPGVPPSFDRARRDNIRTAEAYDAINDNPFLQVAQNPLSTFSIDVDTASYSNVRRFLTQNQLPPRDAVRIEEMLNYFSYDYPQPLGNNPIGASIEAAAAPWSPQHRLVRVGIKARDVEARRRPASNFVFLLDVSGSMQPQERLPLLKDGLRMLVQQLTANDRVTVVTYAGTTGVALQPTRGDQKDVILSLIDSLQAGGSTNGASGIQLAYQQATANFIPGGVNRVILATDGDFNVGITNRNALLRLIEDKAKSGVFLSVLGVGMGNYKDATLEMLADKGNGNFAYLDTLNEARKVLVEQMNGTLITMAKDVKVQVEFNPAVVDAYRLIGYENRALRNEDFNNDQKDAGDMGAGHTVTALYEVVPRGVSINAPGVDALKYQQPAPAPVPAPNASNETLTVKIRYKEPSGNDSKLLVFPLVDREQTFARSSVDFRFAAAVASFGMILRDSPYKGTGTIDSVLSMAEDSLGSDRNGYRREFLQLVQRARQIRGRQPVR